MEMDRNNSYNSNNRRFKYAIDAINEPRTIKTDSKTFSYGETPTAVCRRHFEEMASHFNVSPEKLAENVLKGSLAEQLLKLAEFYKSKDDDAGAVYEPLVQQAIKPPTSTSPDEDKNKYKEKKTQKRMRIIISPKRKQKTSELSQINSIRQEERRSSMTIEASSSKDTSAKSVPDASPEVANSSENSANAVRIGATLPSNDSSNEQIITPEVDTSQSSPIPQSTNSNAQINPSHMQERLSTTDGVEKKETREELEAFLFGDVPYVAKTPPQKKRKKPTDLVINPGESSITHSDDVSSSAGFSRPSLTFDPVKWSPSKQRDLLSIAKDIENLQRSLEAGVIPEEPVSKLVSFTKPSD